MKKLLPLLIITIIFLGCKKNGEEENYTLTGIVMDFDANTPIADAKVYVREYGLGGRVVDSALTDANGRATFTYQKQGAFKFLYPAKTNYLNPINWIGYFANYEDRTETLFLAKPSFINVTAHKANSYLTSDTVNIQVIGDNLPSVGQTSAYRMMLRDKADSPDRIFNLQAVYGKFMGSIFYGSSKLYFKTDLIRSGAIISTREDSVSVIQFGTQHATINY